MMRPRTAAGAALDEALFAIFCGGWSSLTRAHDCRNIDLELVLDNEAMRREWQIHRTAAIAEAQRRGLARPLWAETQFGHGDSD